MYTIHMDGVQMFNTAVVDDPAFVALNPKFHPDTGGNGSLSFVLPPGNRMHGAIQKMKSIVTLEQDGEQLFRGRVLDVESDFYNQKTVYCEGDRSFLLDSLHAPYTYDGTVHGLFQKLVANHNQHVDVEKRFTVGQITAVSSSETVKIESESYASTSDEIESRLLGAYGGYLRTRTVGNTTYLDWVEQYGDVNAQPIEFSVNMLDLKHQADAGDVFTVLIPLGASAINDEGEYTDPLTVESVNNGKNYIQDDAAVALYGKIWRTHSWSYEDNPQKLLEKGREYLKTGAVLETLTLKAVDMHFVDGNVRPIRVGDIVRILSNPHGVDRTVMCTSIEVDLLNPENTVYTFGEKPRTLTENYVRTENEVGGLTGGGRGGGGRSVKEELEEIIRWATINVNEALGRINLNVGEIDNTKKRISSVEIDLNGTETTIGMKAQVLDHGERISGAEFWIDGAESVIAAKADLILLEGYVKATAFEAEIAQIDAIFAGNANAQNLYVNDTVGAQWGNFTNMWFGNNRCAWKNGDFVTSVTFPVYQEDTIYYTNSSGDSAQMRVLTPTKKTSGSYSKSDNYYYIGRNS